jgi:hypothetical protein
MIKILIRREEKKTMYIYIYIMWQKVPIIELVEQTRENGASVCGTQHERGGLESIQLRLGL